MIKKRIMLALSFLLLGLLACMQSAPSSPTQPATQAAQSITAASAELTCYVNTHALNVRDCASMDCSIIGWLSDGWTVKAERSSSSWIYITRGNLSGFSRADYLTCNSGE